MLEKTTQDILQATYQQCRSYKYAAGCASRITNCAGISHHMVLWPTFSHSTPVHEQSSACSSSTERRKEFYRVVNFICKCLMLLLIWCHMIMLFLIFILNLGNISLSFINSQTRLFDRIIRRPTTFLLKICFFADVDPMWRRPRGGVRIHWQRMIPKDIDPIAIHHIYRTWHSDRKNIVSDIAANHQQWKQFVDHVMVRWSCSGVIIRKICLSLY